MSISSGWDNDEKTIYRCTVSGRWTLDEFIATSQQYRHDLGEVTHPVVTIVDLRGARLAAGTLMQAMEIVRAQPIPNDVLTVVISNSRLWRRTFQTIQSLFTALFAVQPRTIWVTSDKEAYRVIEQFHSQHV